MATRRNKRPRRLLESVQGGPRKFYTPSREYIYGTVRWMPKLELWEATAFPDRSTQVRYAWMRCRRARFATLLSAGAWLFGNLVKKQPEGTLFDYTRYPARRGTYRSRRTQCQSRLLAGGLLAWPGRQ